MQRSKTGREHADSCVWYDIHLKQVEEIVNGSREVFPVSTSGWEPKKRQLSDGSGYMYVNVSQGPSIWVSRTRCLTLRYRLRLCHRMRGRYLGIYPSQHPQEVSGGGRPPLIQVRDTIIVGDVIAPTGLITHSNNGTPANNELALIMLRQLKKSSQNFPHCYTGRMCAGSMAKHLQIV